jgi:hypothetical protein
MQKIEAVAARGDLAAFLESLPLASQKSRSPPRKRPLFKSAQFTPLFLPRGQDRRQNKIHFDFPSAFNLNGGDQLTVFGVLPMRGEGRVTD